MRMRRGTGSSRRRRYETFAAAANEGSDMLDDPSTTEPAMGIAARYRTALLAALLLTLLVSTGCPPPSISFLSERALSSQPVFDVTFDDKLYKCFSVRSIDDLNALFRQGNIVKVRIELVDGTELEGTTVTIDGGTVVLRERKNTTRSVSLSSVRRFVPYTAVKRSKRLEYFFGIVGGCAALGVVGGSEYSNTEGAAVGAAVGAVIGAPLYLRRSEAREPIMNLYNEEVSEKTKLGW